MKRLYRWLVEFLANLYIDTMRRAGELVIAETAETAAANGKEVYVVPKGAMGRGEEVVEN